MKWTTRQKSAAQHVRLRCTSTPPPTNHQVQQCDDLEGHVGPHWFNDGMTTNRWSMDHMQWCGLDTDHNGICLPPRPDDGTRPEPGPCGHERPFDCPSGLTCTCDEGHGGCHSAPYKPGYTWYTWVNDADPMPVVVRTYDEVCGNAHEEEPVRAVCWTPDLYNLRRCDLDEGHHGVHSGGGGFKSRESWPPCCCEEHRVGEERCGQCPVHDGPYRTEGLDPPPTVPQGENETLIELLPGSVSPGEEETLIELQARVAHSAVRLLEASYIVSGDHYDEMWRTLEVDVKAWQAYYDTLKNSKEL